MSNHIDKNDPKRWFYVQTDSSGESSLTCFGNSGAQFVSETITGQFSLEAYLTEKELETEVNTIAGNSEYYKNSVEGSFVKFQEPSGLYEPFPVPDLPEDTDVD